MGFVRVRVTRARRDQEEAQLILRAVEGLHLVRVRVGVGVGVRVRVRVGVRVRVRVRVHLAVPAGRLGDLQLGLTHGPPLGAPG